MKTFIVACLAGALLSDLAAAAASTDSRSARYHRTATVHVADLDLTRERDARIVYERIEYAARAICTANELSFDTKKRVERRRCIEGAVASAVQSANAPLLSAIHLQRREQLARL